MNSTLRQRSANADSTQPANAENKPPSIAAPKRQKLTVLKGLSMLVRVVSSLTFIVLSVPVLYLLLPLRPLHPILRKLGIQNNYLPLDLIAFYWGRIFLLLLGIKVITEGAETIPTDQALVFMYSHASNLDAFILLAWTPVAVKFIFKKSLLFTMPLLFPLAWLYGHIPIDRQNREKAIKSITKAGKKIAKYKRSVCIAPEGTRSTTGEIQAFKKGPFHLSKGSGVPIVPVLLFNNFDIWPTGQLFPFSGTVIVRYLPQIVPQASETIESLSDRVRSEMLKEFNNKPTIPKTSERFIPAIIFLVLLSAYLYFG